MAAPRVSDRGLRAGSPRSAAGGGRPPGRGARVGRGSRCRARRRTAGGPSGSAATGRRHPVSRHDARRLEGPRTSHERDPLVLVPRSGGRAGRRRAVCRRRPRRPGARRRRARSSPRSRDRCRQPRAASPGAALGAPPPSPRPSPRTPPRGSRGKPAAAAPSRGRSPRAGGAAPAATGRGGGAPRTRGGLSAAREARARSTLAHAVFCTRIAPTQTSNADSPGHHPAWP